LKRDPKSLLWDACEAANAIAAMTAGKTFEDFDRDIVLSSAVERQFEIAGEALRQLAGVDAALAAKIPDLRAIVAFRNILIHGYALIDRARVWRVVQVDLPELREVLNDLLAESQ
jgi:uncharacterized protein with HEPN domain